MARVAKNKDLHKAKDAKQDEFYTQLSDIERELRFYERHFKNKVVYCNCDDPYESNFFKYFALNFNFLGLKKLIATCYTGSSIANTQLSLFDYESEENKAWLGINMGRGISGFIVPDQYKLYGTEARIDSLGNRIISTNNCLW